MSYNIKDNDKEKQAIRIISDEVISSDLKEIPQSSNRQTSGSKNTGNVSPGKQTIRFLSSKDLKNSNHIRQLDKYCIEPLVIIDIISKLNEKYGKHDVQLFEFLREHIDHSIEMRFDECCFSKETEQSLMDSKQILDGLNRMHGKQIYDPDTCILYDGGQFEIIPNLESPEKEMNCKKCKSRNGCNCSPDGELASVRYIPSRCSSANNDSKNEKKTTKKSILSSERNKRKRKSESPDTSSSYDDHEHKRKRIHRSSRHRKRSTSSLSFTDDSENEEKAQKRPKTPHPSSQKRSERHKRIKNSESSDTYSKKKSRRHSSLRESQRKKMHRYSRHRRRSTSSLSFKTNTSRGSSRDRTERSHRSRKGSESCRSRASSHHRSEKDDLMPKRNSKFFYSKYLKKNGSEERKTPKSTASDHIGPQVPYYGRPYPQPMFYPNPQMYPMYVPGAHPMPPFPYGYNPRPIRPRPRLWNIDSRFRSEEKDT